MNVSSTATKKYGNFDGEKYKLSKNTNPTAIFNGKHSDVLKLTKK